MSANMVFIDPIISNQFTLVSYIKYMLLIIKVNTDTLISFSDYYFSSPYKK